MAVKTIAIGGEAGDAIHAMPSIRALGGGHIVCPDRPWNRPLWSKRCLGLKRLAESQSYIHSWNPYDGQVCDIDLTNYRAGGQRHGELIPHRISRWARVKVDIDTLWLEVEGNPATKGRIIVNRAPRWVGPGSFPWKKIVQTFQKEILFVGTDQEHHDFCTSYGPVERFVCQDMLDVAQAIKGSELFIGAQSCPLAVAEGMKHPVVVEVCHYAPDTMFLRPDAVHYVTGTLKFSACGKDFEAPAEPIKIDRAVAPPGGYRITIGTKTMQDWNFARLEQTARAESMVQKLNYTISQVRSLIEQHSGMPIPSEFRIAA